MHAFDRFACPQYLHDAVSGLPKFALAISSASCLRDRWMLRFIQSAAHIRIDSIYRSMRAESGHHFQPTRSRRTADHIVEQRTHMRSTSIIASLTLILITIECHIDRRSMRTCRLSPFSVLSQLKLNSFLPVINALSSSSTKFVRQSPANGIGLQLPCPL